MFAPVCKKARAIECTIQNRDCVQLWIRQSLPFYTWGTKTNILYILEMEAKFETYTNLMEILEMGIYDTSTQTKTFKSHLFQKYIFP